MLSPRRSIIAFVACVAINKLPTCSVYAQTSQVASISGNNNIVIQNVIELSQGDPDWLANNQTVVANLADRLGLTEALIINFLRTVDLSAVPREQWAAVLKQHAANFVELRR